MILSVHHSSRLCRAGFVHAQGWGWHSQLHQQSQPQLALVFESDTAVEMRECLADVYIPPLTLLNPVCRRGWEEWLPSPVPDLLPEDSPPRGEGTICLAVGGSH